jgi:hypothetical protein
MSQLRALRRIWHNDDFGDQRRKYYLIEKVLMSIAIFLSYISLSNVKLIFPDKMRHSFMDLYVIVFATVVSVALFTTTHLGILGICIAAYRIWDIYIYRIYFLLVKSETRPWKAATARRSLLIVFINFYETIASYALLYIAVATIVGTTAATNRAMTSVSAFYYSAVTAVTVGYGDYVPGDDSSRLLVLSQLFGTLLFLVVLIPALMSIPTSEPKGASDGPLLTR